MTGQGTCAPRAGPRGWRRREPGTLPVIVANARRPWLNPWATDEAAVARVRAGWVALIQAADHRYDTSPVDPCEEVRRA